MLAEFDETKRVKRSSSAEPRQDNVYEERIETWALSKQEENAINVSVRERGIERVMLGVTRFAQVKEEIRSSLLRHRWKIRDAKQRRDATGQHLHAIWTNGSITGARSSRSINNGGPDDTGKDVSAMAKLMTQLSLAFDLQFGTAIFEADHT
ncbi:hypothetical protein RB195_011711 [Necator americanus]|uniref:Uncharacterized protein n=1 Tax=Necator americanus TaxID=51031 RepID=A0ABR1D3N6_NECAM